MIKIFTFKGRELYHNAWKFMYFSNKGLYKDPIFDEVNPLQNKELGTEVEVYSAVAFDDSPLSWTDEEIAKYSLKNSQAVKKSNIDITKMGIPVGIQSWVVTKSKIIGKQMIVSPEYQGRGICPAMMIQNGQNLKGAIKLSTGSPFEFAYIGCSQYSKPILEHKFGLKPFSSDIEGDLYKFNIPMNDLSDNEELRNKLVEGRSIGIY